MALHGRVVSRQSLDGACTCHAEAIKVPLESTLKGA
jgi:hypothetical protein